MRCVLLATLIAMIPPALGETMKDGPTNRLSKESSPYLLQHARNPVDWYPWGPEAFEKAKKEKKLVFLSIGYSSCHWCHVMERESFEDKEVAAILNKHFVCIKVDREERPDIDDIYMAALHAMDARGGWPLSMFMTDEGKPIVGGTYWPKEDRKIGDQTARGFKSILNFVNDLWTNQEKAVREQADEIARVTNEQLTRAGRVNALVEPTRSLALGTVEDLREAIDPKHGGTGNKSRRFEGTKFPMPPTFYCLLQASRREKDAELANLVTLTLTKMAEGGIYDQLGGGFHRYSTERTWTVPHFEKMLYDNAQLVELYSEAYRIDPKPLYKRIVAETITFIQREMTSPQGLFYSALDADSEGKEGESYVWTADEIEKALGDKALASLARAAYSVSGAPNFEDRSFVLKITRPLSEIATEQKLTEAELQAKLETIKTKLLAVRAKRPQPFLDTKAVTSWNGQMIAGLSVASQAFKQPEYAKVASKAADFLLANVKSKDGRLFRTYTVVGGKGEAKLNGYLEDYAYLVHGLLCLHDATGEARWLTEARALTDTMTKWFSDGERGGFFFTSSDHEKLFARPKDHYDGVQPSSNSMAARNLLRLAQKTKEASYLAACEKVLRQFAGALKTSPTSLPMMAEVLQQYLEAKPAAAPKDGKPGEQSKDARRTEDVVTMSASATPADKDGKRTIAVKLSIAAPWHIYANPVGRDEFEGAATMVDVWMNDKKVPATASFPKGKSEKDEKGAEYKVYEGDVTITLTVADAKGEMEVRARAMACCGGDNARCLPKAVLRSTVK